MSCPVRRTVAPNSLPALGKLCIYCENLDFRALLQPESGEYQHHESLDDLFKSATSGCGICQLFHYSSEVHPQDEYDEVKAGGRILVTHYEPGVFCVKSRLKVEEEASDSDFNMLCRIEYLIPKDGEC